MKKVIFRQLVSLFLTFNFIACSSGNFSPNERMVNKNDESQYLKSGTITVTYNLDTFNHKNNATLESSAIVTEKSFEKMFSPIELAGINACIEAEPSTLFSEVSISNSSKHPLFAPIVGFFPLSLNFKAADNEVWMQIDKGSNLIEVFKGQDLIKTIKAEGQISLAPGEYPLQHKQRNPLWYAPDEYFTKRELRVPPRGDHFRYRRGALGNYAVYPTMDFAIHSGPFWTQEVGGLKVSEPDLASIFVMLNVGTPIVVK